MLVINLELARFVNTIMIPGYPRPGALLLKQVIKRGKQETFHVRANYQCQVSVSENMACRISEAVGVVRQSLRGDILLGWL